MATNKQILNKLALTLWMATFVVMPNVSSAAPGTLASVPLFTAANADPNIMFHLDTSGSMNHVKVESEYLGVATYDSTATYDADYDSPGTDACVGGLIPAGSTVKLEGIDDSVVATGVPYFSYSGFKYELGNDAGE